MQNETGRAKASACFLFVKVLLDISQIRVYDHSYEQMLIY